MAINLASRYAKEVDERFTREAQSSLVLGNKYKFTGEKTVNVYSIPTAPMQDYVRSGDHRYGTPEELPDNVQSMTVTKDRSFTFTIDKGNKIQQQMVKDAGAALNRQIREVMVPEFDTYVFNKLAEAALAKGHYNTEAVTKDNAYAVFLKGQEILGNCNVPDSGRVALCSYGFANLLKQDAAFMKYSDQSQEMVIKGVLGEVDGCKIVKVPASRLPNGAAFILTHPIAAVGPKQLEDYKIHDNPPGISGWLVEGRMIYDCFVLDSKADAVYYHGGQAHLTPLSVTSTAGDAAGKSVIAVTPASAASGNKRVYKTGTAPTAVTYDQALASGWTDLPADGIITPTKSHTVVQVVEVTTADSKARAVGQAALVIKA